jgi:probable F420-dependent oxidoreductase
VKFDAYLRNGMEHIVEDIRLSEEVGYDGAFNGEGQADAFLPIALAAANSTRLEMGSAVAIAFARTPMTIAYQAIDLQRFSAGRFILGLGPQIRPHIENRFSMPWSQPAARMKEFVLAIRTIWDSWDSGDDLNFAGEFYRHTLMTPNFVPAPNPYGPPKIFLAAVGPQMIRVAAQMADGVFVHPLTSELYLRETLLPKLAAHRPGDKPPLEIALAPFVALNQADAEAARRKIAFYGSTPAYLPVLEVHGWADLHLELNAMSKRGLWDEMTTKIDDEVLNAFCSVGTESEVAADLSSRFGSIADRIRFNRPDDDTGPSRFVGIMNSMRGMEQ